jgi:hypothetical protein
MPLPQALSLNGLEDNSSVELCVPSYKYKEVNITPTVTGLQEQWL